MDKKKREANRKKVAAWRAKQKVTTEAVTKCVTPVTDEEIEKLSPEAKQEISRVTGIMAACGINNLRERQEMAVRRLRGF